jgi:MscS family membrane protein
LAAQDSLKNLFGSLMILLDQPFREGDRVRAKGYEGVVKDVGLRSTKLRLDNGHLVTISNDEMARLDTENISRRPYLRRNETIRLRSDTPPEKVQKAAEIVRRLLQNHEGMDDDLLPQVRIGANDSIALAVTMTYWYHPPKAAPFAAFNERINQELLRQFQAEGINLA